MFAFEIQHLAAYHPLDGADGVGNEADDLDGRGGRAIEIGQHLKGACLQGIAGQNSDGLAVNNVTGRLAMAQVVVVQGRKVIVNKRVGVEHLDGRAQPLDTRRQLAGNGNGGLHGQQWPQAFASGKCGVAHGAMNRGGHGLSTR